MRSAGLVLVAANSIWALNYTVVKFGLGQINPLAFPVLRFGLGGLVLAAILRWREGGLGVKAADLPLLLATGVLGITLNQVFFMYSLTATGASDVALLGATGPLLTASLATAIGLEQLGRRHWLGALLGMGGVAMIVLGGVSASLRGASLLGDLLALAATLCSSGSALIISRLLERYSAMRILTYQMLLGSAVLVPFALPALASQDYGRVTPSGWGSLAYTVVFAGIVCNLLYFTGIDRLGPSRTAMFSYMQALLGAVLAAVILRETLTVVEVCGGLIVIGSIVLSQPRAARIRAP